jgi:hypothetical protein
MKKPSLTALDMQVVDTVMNFRYKTKAKEYFMIKMKEFTISRTFEHCPNKMDYLLWDEIPF